jgi:hypothetical protein
VVFPLGLLSDHRLDAVAENIALELSGIPAATPFAISRCA